ncbi:TerD family protein [Streptomyces sp. T-3]|nr:TerD family protein [Streptomyces sp. T-3]
MSVRLTRGRSVLLTRAGGRRIPVIRMALTWKAAVRSDPYGRPPAWEMDLDVAAVRCAGAVPVDVVFFRNRVSDDGSTRHSSDSARAGTGRDDDESIVVDLRKVPASVGRIAFVAASFSGQTSEEVEHTRFRLADETTGEELAHFALVGGGGHSALVLAKVQRSGPDWRVTAMSAPASGRTFQDLMPGVTAHL